MAGVRAELPVVTEDKRQWHLRSDADIDDLKVVRCWRTAETFLYGEVFSSGFYSSSRQFRNRYRNHHRLPDSKPFREFLRKR